jgi:hypothetical protein
VNIGVGPRQVVEGYWIGPQPRLQEGPYSRFLGTIILRFGDRSVGPLQWSGRTAPPVLQSAIAAYESVEKRQKILNSS